MSGYTAIGLGTTADDGTGDTARVAGGKINTQFQELFGRALKGTTDPGVATGNGCLAGETTYFNTTTGVLFVLRDATSGANVWTRVTPGMFQKPVSGRWYGPAHSLAFTQNANTANQIRMCPIIIPERVVITDLAICTGSTVGAASNFKVGLYDISPTTGLPLNLLTSCIITTGGAGSTTYSNTVSTPTIEPGVYAGAVLPDTAININSLQTTDGVASMVVGGVLAANVLAVSGYNIGWAANPVGSSYANGLPSVLSVATHSVTFYAFQVPALGWKAQ